MSSQVRQWTKVATEGDMREGEGFDTGVEVAGDIVGIFKIDGQLYAIGECTHESGPVCQGNREGFEAVCPWHSAKFNVATGECLQGPVACRTDGSVGVGEIVEVEKVPALNCYDVKVEGGEVYVSPREKS